MKIRIHPIWKITIDCENVVTALAVVYLLQSVLLFANNSSLEKCLDLVQYALLVGVCFFFIRQRFSEKSLLRSVLVLICFVISAIMSGVFPLFKYGLVIFACMRCNKGRLVTQILRCYVIGVSLIFLLGWLKILPSDIARRGYSSLGFSHPNLSAAYILSILCCYVIQNYHTFRWKNYGVILVLIVASYVVTNSRTSAMVMVILAVMVPMCKGIGRFFRPHGLLYWPMVFLPFLLFGISFLVGYAYDIEKPFYAWLDPLLNGRPWLADQLINAHNIVLWGQQIDRKLVENTYLVCLYNYGLIPTLIEFTIMSYAIKKSIDNNNHGELICLIVFCFHGLMETAAVIPFLNVALLFAFSRKQTSDKNTYRNPILYLA